MAVDRLPPRPLVHECPVCHHPQTRIQRKLSDDRGGATSFVCTRVKDCSIGMDLACVSTWVAV